MKILMYFFKKAISLLPPLNRCSADDLVENFNLKIVKVIALYKVKTISGEQKAPWRKAASVTAQKKECRKGERIGVKQNFIFTMISIKRASVPII